jgi:hypothetical protein
MGTEEKDRRRGEEPDVEAHKHRIRANEEPRTEPEDKKSGDDEPDVEAHKFRMR